LPATGTLSIHLRRCEPSHNPFDLLDCPVQADDYNIDDDKLS